MIGFGKFKVCQKAIRKVNQLDLVSILSLAFQLESERVNECLFYALYCLSNLLDKNIGVVEIEATKQ